MKESIYLAVYDGISDWEYGYVLAHINSQEFQAFPDRFVIKTVGRNKESIRTKGGLTVVPDLSLDKLNPSDGKMLILCGSDNAASGGIDDFVDAAKRFIDNGICVAAICGATAALARKGILDNVPHTSNAKEFLEMTGYAGSQNYIQEPVVSTDYLITAGGIEPIAFAAEIFRKLEIYSETTLDSWLKLFEQRDITGFYELMENSFNE
ncbi:MULTISPECIES: DJ-1/PfpI family protein [unclassified Vibrio]|uniref:DJ-1/PfpI family protein n=1 Tax=unclassified Vibrio TaxID=2614977 RepID=UPI000C855EED|nr:MULTISPECIES: DJ-1/PfpI family protein [unclassified Vibrio]MCG9552772.1 DJ-1/PfpI family protein [Vibrio sp. Isolate32]MCG9601370.1 DJ-1/PfpI family protein [Vibrio sp. Isolate31]MDA0155983.1 DJ-1/PfpI family protein [Vibrio sp. Makdt]PMI21218.1 thiamine biosynthesis protein ThiJ [Vibrio sp. 10N.286.46.E10]PMI99258.1 thiamine biosynthesis protein ThiJ [Vibrio sp. 10N.286.45.E10]